jgi:septal ring factor EnvC (AmiA/AmiB activator)
VTVSSGAGLVLAGILSAALAVPAAAQDNVARRLRENQERLEAIRRERDQASAELEALRSRMRDLAGELVSIDRQKTMTTRIVNELDRQIGQMNTQLDTATIELLLAQDAHAEKRAVLEQRLVEIYKRGPLWIFEVLLAAESFGDLLSRYKYLYLVSRQDRALVGEIEILRDRIAHQRTQMVRLKGELGHRRDERSDELLRYYSLERQRQRTLRDAEHNRAITATRLDSLERDEQRLSNIITALEAERRRALARGATAPATSTLSDRDVGRLDWPAEGRVVYRMGFQRGPNNTRLSNNGVGIALPIGTPVKAVAAGAVGHAGLLGTYGMAVIINHGGGYYTSYLYLSELKVQYRDWVEAGDVIGLSGGAASEVGPHIEFQLYQSQGEGASITLDPLLWLKSAGR